MLLKIRLDLWQAKAQSIEEPNQNLRYSLKGEDADLFN